MGIVLVTDPDASFAQHVEDSLARESDMEVVRVPTLSLAAELVDARDPHVLLLGPSIDVTAALETASRIAESHPETSVVLVAKRVTTELLKQALRAGLRDVASAEDTFAEVSSSVRDAYRSAARLRMGGTPGIEQSGGKGKVVTVFSTKGGVGKSVISTNLGAALVGLDKRVVVLDLDLQFGDVGIMLQLPPERTISDAVKSFDRLDAEMLKGFLSSHPSGLKALLAPVRPEEAESVTPARLGAIIGMLKQIADIVIIDTPSTFDESVLTAIDHSDEVYAIATMDVASIKNTKVSLQKLRQLGYDESLVRLVLNRADSKVLLEPGDVEQALDEQILARIPSDRLVPRSVNKGVPVVLDEPRSPVARALNVLAAIVTESTSKEVEHVA